MAGVIKAVNKALDKGQLRNEGNALVLLGMAYYKQQQYNQAIATFNRASGIADVAAISEQWQNFVQGQKDKRELIASQ